MKENVILWVLGVIFTLVLGAYGFASKIGADAEATMVRIEDKVTTRLDKLDEKLDRVLDRVRRQ